jgi:sialic acid synthase SpsE/mannose-6-phosphate isomerase-like protein (cupin superfamily)
MLEFNEEKPLFICDLANNHFGDLNHAKSIIDEVGNVAAKTKETVSVKFQFRNLENYIHRDFKSRRDLKYIDRFLSTKLEKDDFKELTQYIKSKRLISMATPFDEDGVEWCEDLDIEIIKIASASSNDYPLIERIKQADKPVVASTAGLRLDEIDNLVFKLYNNVPKLVIMHCVALYPCEESSLNLNQIRSLRERYPQIGIGFSTHERPEASIPVSIATSLGAVALERHVGIKTERYPINDYSSNPNQIEEWILNSVRTRKALGTLNRPPSPKSERDTLNDLKRGIYARSKIGKGERIDASNVYFAFPLSWREGQFHAGMLESELVASEDISENHAIGLKNALHDPKSSLQTIKSVVLQVKGLLANAKIEINPEAIIELSHHYGLDRIREFGAILITCYNDEYAKKIVVQLPRQKHPYHYHSEKQETFQLLWGDMELTVDGREHLLKPGELFTVKRGEWHKFHSLHGAVVEEISTRAIPGDSYYEDPLISNLELSERKTSIPNWITT